MNNRQLTIMRMLEPNRKFTASELAGRFGVSLRTIQRDLEKLQQIGFPLYSEPGRHGGYRVLPNRLLPPLQLNENEALGLYLMLHYFQQLPDLPFNEVRSHLAENYFAELPDSTKEKIRLVETKVVFKLSAQAGKHNWTTLILQAALEQQELFITYESPNGQKDVTVFPLGLYFDQAWYMPALYKDHVLLYRADRIHYAKIGDKIDHQLPLLTDWLNRPEDRPSVQTVLAFSSEGARRAKADPLFKAVSEGIWRGSIPYAELSYTASQLLSYGPHVKVLEPQELAEQIKQHYTEALKQYE
ncbi:helix-turn-helix transcriptional regulator [Jeotgalibacillus proteolyticus]|uniref:Transcriptional regulator n=1 Tax=Jeotgalibacillus proteolyticus TaxID=2082395 RepID=A0A2S5G6A5_9BACL|nr:YafY family protein [Jeotgalibacillus proteolyticus]PPA68516.1 transcriptional regulator [Jeotgalibacillus proteolyticus]